MMKEKFKKVFKNSIFIFVLGVLVSGVVGVCAVTYFPSGDVTYDNTESGLESTNVQGAIDELYSACSTPQISGPASDILDKVDTVTSGDGLYKDEYEEGRYFYRGANPNNYITFNNELWRILSVEKDGTIKIVSTKCVYKSPLGEYSGRLWGTSDLRRYDLNDNYMQTLSDADKITYHKFNVGEITLNNNDLKSQIGDESAETLGDNIALITLSEYLRANSNMSACGTFSLNNSNPGVCLSTNWLSSIGEDFWTITCTHDDTNHRLSISIYPWNGYITANNTTLSFCAMPTLYLSQLVKITGGAGTESNPYTLG